MKPLTDYIEKIHELPEQTRKIAAGFSIVAAGILAIFIMHANITAQLAENTQNEEINQAQSTGTIAQTMQTPVEGLAESLASLRKILPSSKTDVSHKGLTEKTKEMLNAPFAALGRGFSILWNYFDTP